MSQRYLIQALNLAKASGDRPLGAEILAGHCFRELRQPAQAERFARRSLDMDNNYVRGRAFNLVLLAHAYAQQGEVKQACAVGFKAIDLAAGLNSVRAVRYLSDLRRELAPYRTAPAVVRLDERLQPLLGAVA